MTNNVDSKSDIVKTNCGRNAWKTVISSKMWKALCDIIYKIQSAICLQTKLPQSENYANKTSTLQKAC